MVDLRAVSLINTILETRCTKTEYKCGRYILGVNCRVLLTVFVLGCFASCSDNDPVGVSIGTIDHSDFVLTDSIALKDKFLKETGNEGKLNLSSIKIVHEQSIGEKSEKNYMLLAYDSQRGVRIARCLHEKANRFYLEEGLKVKSKRDDLFYASYFITNDCDEDCYPYIAFLNGRKMWVAKKTFVCSPESRCKPETVIYE